MSVTILSDSGRRLLDHTAGFQVWCGVFPANMTSVGSAKEMLEGVDLGYLGSELKDKLGVRPPPRPCDEACG